VKILGKKDEPGRPILYGTSSQFLEFFGLKSLKDLPTLREFTELNEDSMRTVEKELGDALDAAQPHEEAPTTELAPTTHGDVESTAEDEAQHDEHRIHAAAPASGEAMPASSEMEIDEPEETVSAFDDDPTPSESPNR